MDSAEELFIKLKSFKVCEGEENTPEKQFIKYCKETLGAIERLHFDFKEKENRSNHDLGNSDKKNLAKAISGFSNSSGGVLIWGVEDKTLESKPISGVQGFIDKLLDLSTNTTDPLVLNIDGDWIPSEDDNSTGYGILYIPESPLPPHRVILNNKDIRTHYYIRTANSFLVATHTQLEDMFGRRPKPKLLLYTNIKPTERNGSICTVQIILGITNTGRGPAKSPFLSIELNSPYHVDSYGLDGNFNFGLPELKSSTQGNERKYGASSNVVIHSGITHEVTVVKGKLNQEPSKTDPDLIINYNIAAENIPLILGQKIITTKEMFKAIKTIGIE